MRVDDEVLVDTGDRPPWWGCFRGATQEGKICVVKGWAQLEVHKDCVIDVNPAKTGKP